eukprot:2953911-Amphidinium_carterae.1
MRSGVACTPWSARTHSFHAVQWGNQCQFTCLKPAKPVDDGRTCQFVPRTPCPCHTRVVRQDDQDGQSDDFGGHRAQEQLGSKADSGAEPAAVR